MIRLVQLLVPVSPRAHLVYHLTRDSEVLGLNPDLGCWSLFLPIFYTSHYRNHSPVPTRFIPFYFKWLLFSKYLCILGIINHSLTFIGNSLWSACDQTMIQIDLIMYWPKWFLHKSQTQNAICRGENIMTFFMVFWWKKSGGTVMKHIRHCMTYQYLVLKLIIRCHRSVLITILATISAWIKKMEKRLL